MTNGLRAFSHTNYQVVSLQRPAQETKASRRRTGDCGAPAVLRLDSVT